MKKTAIIIGSIILLIGAAWAWMNPGQNILEAAGLKKPAALPLPGSVKDDLTGKTPESGAFVPKAPIQRDSNGFPLQQGISGSLLNPDSLVRAVQKALNERHGSTLKLDGIYGPKTGRALNTHGYPALIYLDEYYEILGV